MTQDPIFQQTKAEASRLKSLLKTAEKERATLTDPTEKTAARQRVKDLQNEYEKVHRTLLALKDEYRWNISVGREFDCIAGGEEPTTHNS